MAIEIVDLPIKNGGSFHSYVSLPEGKHLIPVELCQMLHPPGASGPGMIHFFGGLAMIWGPQKWEAIRLLSPQKKLEHGTETHGDLGIPPFFCDLWKLV